MDIDVANDGASTRISFLTSCVTCCLTMSAWERTIRMAGSTRRTVSWLPCSHCGGWRTDGVLYPLIRVGRIMRARWQSGRVDRHGLLMPLPTTSISLEPMAGELQGPAVLGDGPHYVVGGAFGDLCLDLQGDGHLGSL